MKARPKKLKQTPPSENTHLLRWVEKTAQLTEPAAIHWVDGSQAEYDQLCREMVESGTFTRLNEELWPGCYYARSDASDVARVESRTFICSLSKDSAGPTNNWENPFVMRRKLKSLFKGCMRGRTMFVLPFSMGPVGSPMSQIGVQLTDSPYVVVSMRIMARIGMAVFKEIDKDEKRVVPCLHSVGAPLEPGQKDVPWPCNEEKYIVHFPRAAKYGRTDRVTVAMHCLGKNVWPYASRPTSRAMKVGWPSTCSSWESKIRTARKPMLRRLFPVPAGKQILQ